MRLLKLIAAVFMFASAAIPVLAQKSDGAKSAPPAALRQWVASSPAYAELLLRRTELESELEALLIDYTEDHPKVQQNRYALTRINTEIGRFASVASQDAGKLTTALGRLMVRKVELEVDLWSLLKTYKDEHPDVKRARRRVQIYEAAIREILG